MQLFDEILILLAAAIVIVTFFRRLHIPPIIGYLLVGAAVGPHGLGLIPQFEDVAAIGWFGVAFLLFNVGLEFSFPRVKELGGKLVGLGVAQVFGTAAVVALIAWALGVPPVGALAIGAILAQSSSTIIGSQLFEQQEVVARHGRLGLGISVFQDVTAMPFVILLPALGAGGGNGAALAVAAVVGKALLAVAVMMAAGRWLLRPLLRQIAVAQSSELLTLSALLVALAAAWTTDAMGLSMALGAFLGGMMLGESEFRHQLEAEIRPFRDVLLGVFLVTMGMLFNPGALPDIWHWVLLMALGGMAIKSALVAGMVRLAGEHGAIALRTGLILAVGGEFGFALLAIARDSALLSNDLLQITLAAVLLAMLLGPLLIRVNGVFARRLFRSEWPCEELARETEKLAGHVILCGYGRVGRSMARALERGGSPCLGLDFDPVLVREANEAGERVYYGDSTRRDILLAVGIERARLLIVTFDDPLTAARIITLARSLRPGLPALVRTRDEARLDLLVQAGATEVIPETLEASLTLLAHAMLLLGKPATVVHREVEEIRRGRYRLLREPEQVNSDGGDLRGPPI